MNGIAWYELGVTYHALGKHAAVERVLATLSDFEPKPANRLVQVTVRQA